MIRYLLLLLIPITVLAHEVTLRVDGKTLHTVDADKVTVTIGDGKVTVDARTQPKPPTPPAPPPPDPTDCKRLPGVFIQNTGSLAARFTLKAYRPQPGTIVAFKFTTPATGTYSGRATATRSSSSPRTKLITVSKCPGDYKNPVAKTNACVSLGVEASQVVLTTDANQRFRCVLERGSTYYINAVSVSGFNSDRKSCTTEQDCSFWFERDPS